MLSVLRIKQALGFQDLADHTTGDESEYYASLIDHMALSNTEWAIFTKAHEVQLQREAIFIETMDGLLKRVER